jgi:hypothetical protein
MDEQDESAGVGTAGGAARPVEAEQCL